MADRVGFRRRTAAVTATARISSMRRDKAASNEPSVGSGGQRDREKSTGEVTPQRKRSRVDDEDEETKESERPVTSESAKPSGRRSRAGVDTPADEAFLDALVVFKTRMDSAERKYPVWDEIAALFPARFRGGRSAKGRFEWLRQVAQDESHSEHGKISFGMLQKFRHFDAKDAGTGSDAKGEAPAVDEAAGGNEVDGVAEGNKNDEEAQTATMTTKDDDDEEKEIEDTRVIKPKSPKKRRRSVFMDPAATRRKRRREAWNARRSQEDDDDEPEKEVENEERVVESETKTNNDKAEVGNTLVPVLALPTHHRQTEFDPQLEETMMQVVLDHSPKLVSTTRKLDVWTEIARNSRGRYPTATGARNHVAWLVKGMADPAHRVHKLVTPKLRGMLEEFKQLDTSCHGSEPSTPRKKALDKDNAPQIQIESPASVSIPAQKSPKSGKAKEDEADPTSDEKLVTLVMAKKPFAVSGTQKTAVWDDIAACVREVNPALANGKRALKRFNWLVSVFSHEKLAALTESLRKKLSEYLEMTAAYHAKLLRFTIPTNVKTSNFSDSKSTAEDTNSDKVDRGGTTVEVQASAIRKESDLIEPEDTPAHESPETSDVAASDVVRSGTQKPSGTADPVNVENDLLLMQTLLKYRPFIADRYTRTSLWGKLLNVVRPKNPKITTALGAYSRVRWLLAVAENPTHIEYERLTTELLTLLLEYREMDEAAKSKDLKDLLALSLEVADGDEETSNPLVGPNDDLVLCELLRIRPFHAKIGKGMDAWRKVVKSVNRAAGSRVYTTGQACLTRMKNLLAAFRSPSSRPGIQLSKTQRTMVGYVDALLKIRWPTGKTELTATHKLVLKNIDAFLAKFSAVKGMRHPSVKVSSIKKRPVTMNRTSKSQPVTSFNRIDSLQSEIIELRATGARNRIKYENQIRELQERVTKCRTQLEERAEAIDHERKERRTEIRSLMDLLKGERSMHARETATMLEVLEKERIDRRQEFVSLMSLVTRAVLPPTRQAQISTSQQQN